MTRNNAREIAVHLVFGLEFGARSAEEVLKSELSRERFETLGQESPLYAQYPNEKQREYIRALVEGVYAHGEELDAYTAWPGPSCAPPCMRCCICPMCPTPRPLTPPWS